MRRKQSTDLPNGGIQAWPPGSIIDEPPRKLSDRKIEQPSSFVNLEFFMIIFGIGTIWSVFVVILLKHQKFPIQKHFIEVVLMVVVPVLASYACLYLIDLWVSRKVDAS